MESSLFSKPLGCVLRHSGNDLFDFQITGIQAKVIPSHVAPTVRTQKIVVLSAELVHLFDLLFVFFIRAVHVFRFSFPAALNTGFHLGVHKNPQWVLLSQDHIGVASYNDAVAFLRNLFDQFCLLCQQGCG